MTTRRGFLLSALSGMAALATPELWVPRRKTFFLPPAGGWPAAEALGLGLGAMILLSKDGRPLASVEIDPFEFGEPVERRLCGKTKASASGYVDRIRIVDSHGSFADLGVDRSQWSFMMLFSGTEVSINGSLSGLEPFQRGEER